MTEAGVRARAREQTEASVEPPVVSGRAPEPLLALQQSAGNQAVAGVLRRTDAFAVATSGTATEVPRRSAMEAAFGARFDDVRAHLGGSEAEAGLAALGARAATRGAEIAFDEPNPPDRLVAHELAHVVQQRRGGGVPGAAAEHAAEGAASAVAARRPVPDVGAAADGAVQLAPVATAGGTWETTKYKAKDLGAEIELEFKATDPVWAKQIGLVQTVRTECTDEAGRRVPHFKDSRVKALSQPADPKAPPGAAIDQKQDDQLRTSPLYANEGGTAPKRLTEGATSPGLGRHGYRFPVEVGPVNEQSAQLKDTPHVNLQFPEQEWNQTFEVAALALDGPFENMYLGSIEWGWERRWDPDRSRGVSRAHPFPIRVVRHGSPSAEFTAAAKRWNDYRLGGRIDGGPYDTVDLPLADDPRKLSTPELTARLVAARNDAAIDDGTARGPKQLQANALERELMDRNLKIDVEVLGGKDIWGDHDLHVTVAGGNATHRTETKGIAEKQTGTFLVPVHTFASSVPFAGLLVIDAYEEDLGSDGSRVATVVWAGSGTADAPGSAGGASYHITVAYEH